MAFASSMEMVDLPSLGTDEVTTKALTGLSTLAKRMFASSVCAALRTVRSWPSYDFFLFLGMVLPPLLDLGEPADDGKAH